MAHQHIFGHSMPDDGLEIYSRISRPACKPTPIPAAENVAKISDSHIIW